MLTKPYPKDNEPRTMALPADLVDQLTMHIAERNLKKADLLKRDPREKERMKPGLKGARRKEQFSKR